MVNEMKLRSRFDGLPISILVVRPEQEPKAILQLSHGMCGCKERYMPLMQFMAANGIACIAGDHRGHGGSVWTADDLGYMYEGGYRALVDDMRMISDWAHEAFPSKPLFLLGHSMGSLAARLYVRYDDASIDGLVVTGSPSWNPLSYIGRALAWVLCHLGMSRVRMSYSQKKNSEKFNRRFSSEGVQAWTCSDPQVRKSFMDNPLCNFALTANGSYNLMAMMIETYGSGKWMLSQPQLPVLFIAGADDPVVGGEKQFHLSVSNMCKRGYTNVASVLYSDMRHEVLNEIGKETVWTEILDFMSSRAAYGQ